jgi:Protein of unknown function (DUF3800)
MKTANYFVDASGDGVLFDARGRVLLSTDAVSKHFILGLLEVQEPITLAAELDDLRRSLLKDPYFKNVESMRPERQKTALMLHAKDDLPEVRREVFKLLTRHSIKFYAVVRDMRAVLSYELERRRRNESHRYRPDGLYDSTVSRLFKERLHSFDHCHICFAKRGKSDRTEAFEQALARARQRFETQWNREIKTQVLLEAKPSAQEPCLQAVDYMLWALQRHFNAGESRFIETMWDKVGLVHAVDELGQAPYGNYYSKKKPLPANTGAAS